MTSSPAGRAPVGDTDRPGLLPRHTHLLVVLGLAGLLFGVALVSRRGSAKPTQAATLEDPKRTDEDELTRRLREQTQRELAAIEARGKVAPEPAADLSLAAAPPPERAWLAGEGRREGGGGESGADSRRTSSLALSYRAGQGLGSRDASAEGPAPLPRGGRAGGVPGFEEYLREALGQAPPIPGEGPGQPTTGSTEGRNRAGGPGHVLFEGTVLEAVLLSRLSADFSGPAICMVTTDLLTHDGKAVLIPAGSKVLGATKKVDTFGQTRVALAFHRLLMPDGFSVDLRQFVGLNQQGDTALKDKVNHHYLQLFGASIAVGALGALVPTSLAAGDARQGIVPSLGQEAMHILDRFLNVLPTITIREGHRVRVYLTQDLTLPAYHRHRMPRDI